MHRRPSHNPTSSACSYGLWAGLATLAVLLAILGFGALPGSAEEPAADPTVKIANFTFDPPNLTIKAGTTVTWVNVDDIPHLVSEKDGKFRSNALDTDDKFSQTFPTAGTIEYFLRDPSTHDGKDHRNTLNDPLRAGRRVNTRAEQDRSALHATASSLPEADIWGHAKPHFDVTTQKRNRQRGPGGDHPRDSSAV